MLSRNINFIDANNWLFTARGIPVIYYGSEMGFERGAAEHAGNRNYFGTKGIAEARKSPIRASMIRIAKVRQAHIALQRGLQVDLELSGDRAAFWRVYQHAGRNEIALVLLNKGDTAQEFRIDDVEAGNWVSAIDGSARKIAPSQPLTSRVPAHGVQVYTLAAKASEPKLLSALEIAMAGARKKQD